MAANDRGTIGRPDVLARFQVWGGIWPLHWNASLTEGREIVAVWDVVAVDSVIAFEPGRSSLSAGFRHRKGRTGHEALCWAGRLLG